ncbi:(Dimethylallyl)adenosine tRNA methylthiotransferase MiaB [uncultured delta proteobacterium]|uniref:tRNA-2-methylthio-N(6)-dimethylallyladenosine synthase n=1 Tax=uncultured delta proteobacterium TaxID=34034 RepID=A0A212JUX3_9DELT|nr:(Dimethylallyl)adenosine tRNA methylthiotransferase MiaB [uncultured delta proteobacterium]
MPNTFHITTFGCQMNAADSDWLSRSLVARGFVPVAADKATIHILNTCSVRDKPEQKVYSEIGRIRSATGNSPDILVCVGGCVAQQVGEKLFKRFSQVRLVFGTDGIASAPDAIARLAEAKRLRISLIDFADRFEERDAALDGETVPPAAFVNIMQGCDNFCAYCIVPYVRGRQKSRDADAVLAECAGLLERGAKEITLLGQNVNAYGLDLGVTVGNGRSAFGDLLYRVAALPNLSRLRFVTPHPKDMGPDMARAFADLPMLAPRLHLPLQSGSDEILRRMGRKYDTARFLELVTELKAARPEMHFSTDIIVGFPGETEEQFQETLSFMERVGFAGSFSFAYSDRPGTRASLLGDKLDKKTKFDRLARLQAWQYAFASDLLARMQGETVRVLLEGEAAAKDPVPGAVYWQGREERGHSVIVRMMREAPPGGWLGETVPVRVTGASMHGLKGDLA